ncbi:F-box-like domain superfamily [Arabidopsis suecica]|uniref:F-box-like domain superfamily n=1 Tax=Arabidopsis suecica TaxID=45249 RepID=A0A8T2FF01_ARASU|nr:F-box-like domain superfamily [Arabidopsis suecica]
MKIAVKKSCRNLSELPQELLYKILGLLPTRNVVSTSLISHQRRSQFHWMERLKFRYPRLLLDNRVPDAENEAEYLVPGPEKEARFVGFVNNVIANLSTNFFNTCSRD